ncbi:MAG TPA: hypothetical protein VFC46_00435 [Humisphaera sp.]|nr:hypothetical protein [Humisphaera sp.]
MTYVAPMPAAAKHTVLHGVTWDDYENLLAEIGDGSTRVTFLDGSMEIISPLPEPTSALFPFLPLDEFVKFVHRLLEEETNSVMRDFRKWVRMLKRKGRGTKS